MGIEANLTSQSRKLSFNLRDCGTNEQPATSPSSPAITSSPDALGHRLHSPATTTRSNRELRTRYGMEFLAFDFRLAADFPEKAGDEPSVKEIQRLPRRVAACLVRSLG
jgi:hypothetical protein